MGMGMALRSFPANDAEISLKRTGKYALEDQVVGNRVQEFWQARFPTKSPLGLEFIAQNSFLREDVRQILFSILGRPILGLIKVYSDILPSDYVFRVHNGSEEPTFRLLVLLSCPDSVICFYEGSTSEYMGVDVALSKTADSNFLLSKVTLSWLGLGRSRRSNNGGQWIFHTPIHSRRRWKNWNEKVFALIGLHLQNQQNDYGEAQLSSVICVKSRRSINIIDA